MYYNNDDGGSDGDGDDDDDNDNNDDDKITVSVSYFHFSFHTYQNQIVGHSLCCLWLAILIIKQYHIVFYFVHSGTEMQFLIWML